MPCSFNSVDCMTIHYTLNYQAYGLFFNYFKSILLQKMWEWANTIDKILVSFHKNIIPNSSFCNVYTYSVARVLGNILRGLRLIMRLFYTHDSFSCNLALISKMKDMQLPSLVIEIINMNSAVQNRYQAKKITIFGVDP